VWILLKQSPIAMLRILALCVSSLLVGALRVPVAPRMMASPTGTPVHLVRMQYQPCHAPCGPHPFVPSLAAGLAILFDCDGVLADTERDGHRVSFNKAFAERGYDFEWSVEEYGRMCEVGGGKERMTAFFNGFNGYHTAGWPAGHEAPTTEALDKGLPVDPDRLALVKGLHARKTELFQQLIGSGVVPLRPGVLALVDEAIAEGVPLAVCSTSNEAAVRTLVQTLMGDERYARFEFFCGDCVPRKKPNPDVYNLAQESMRLDKA
jgi:beta-phosphoglucomutase-like phosphatase (HAD superfamily)